MVAVSPITFLLLSCLAGQLYTRSDAAGTAVLQSINCSTAGNYTPTDAYAANLNQLLATLPDSTVSKNGGFFNGTAGQPGAPGTSYGLALCAADFARSDCRDCLSMATSNSSGLVKQCPGSSTVVAMYDQCLVHYSDADFRGTAYMEIVYASYGADRLQTAVLKKYSDALKQALVLLNAQAESSPQRFAVSLAPPYALVQCTWDLPPGRCQACLDLLANNASDFMTVKSTGEAKTYTCRVRHSNESFAFFPLVSNTSTSTNVTSSSNDGAGSSNRTVIAAVVSVGVAVAVLLAATAVACCRRGRRARRGGSITMGDTIVHIDLLQEYTYEELKKATGNFSKDSELGRGAFGVVYKGTLDNQKVIAVKKLQRKEKVEVEQFMNEVSILSGLKHKNLVKLEGYCVHSHGQSQEGLLCYEYLADGNLEDRLYGQQHAGSRLSWKERHHILQGISRGLQYLHDESPNDISIIHMDLKVDNILLQEDKKKKKNGALTPKISDFGISRNLDTDKQHEYVAQVVGNVNCMPREFMERGKASPKVDIYSFGLIILEMVTGKPRKSWSSSDTDAPSLYGEGLIKQVREHWAKKEVIEKLKDASLDSDCHDEIEKCIEIALECVKEDPAMRPDIATITRRLTDIGHFTKQEKS